MINAILLMRAKFSVNWADSLWKHLNQVFAKQWNGIQTIQLGGNRFYPNVIEFIEKEFGKEYCLASKRAVKNAEGAQDAHDLAQR